jgi:hypothetical protein
LGQDEGLTKKDVIELLFPRLRGSGYRVTSESDDVYNCVAWAVGVKDKWWWPGDPDRTYWPSDVPRERSVAAFRQLFGTLGFEECADDALEPGFEKVALFVNPLGKPTHAARQLSIGRWTSKLGESEDIEHGLRDLEGDVDGVVVLVMRRPR